MTERRSLNVNYDALGQATQARLFPKLLKPQTVKDRMRRIVEHSKSSARTLYFTRGNSADVFIANNQLRELHEAFRRGDEEKRQSFFDFIDAILPKTTEIVISSDTTQTPKETIIEKPDDGEILCITFGQARYPNREMVLFWGSRVNPNEKLIVNPFKEVRKDPHGNPNNVARSIYELKPDRIVVRKVISS